eukprot:8732761-Pyramimonas_sp.AAC.2
MLGHPRGREDNLHSRTMMARAGATAHRRGGRRESYRWREDNHESHIPGRGESERASPSRD